MPIKTCHPHSLTCPNQGPSPKSPVTYWFRNSILLYSRVKVCQIKSICNKIWNFLDFMILKNFSKFLENSREISLLDLDLEAFSIHLSLSISILRHFHFTFHSRSRYQGIFISLFILEMSEPNFHFTFHFSKWVNQISISLFTSRTSNIHSRRTLAQSCY